MRVAVSLLCLLTVCAASPALAQPSLATTEIQLTPPDPKLWEAQRRARFLLAVGAGLTAGSAVHLAWATRDRQCGFDDVVNNSLYTAGVLGSFGVSFAVFGGTWLAVSSARHGRLPASMAQKWTSVGIAAAGFLTATVLTTLVWGLDSAGCSS